MIQELSKNDLIVRYVVDNKEYFYVKGWRHQRIDKAQPPKYPDPLPEHSTNILGVIPPDTIGEDRIEEERLVCESISPDSFSEVRKLEEERSSRRRSKTPPPPDFVPSLDVPNDLGWSPQKYEIERNRFCDYALAHDRRYANWQKAWANWCRSPFQQNNGVDGDGQSAKVINRQRWHAALDRLGEYAASPASGDIGEAPLRILPGARSG